MKRKARYQSDLRAEQAAATRQRIVEAAAQGFAPWTQELPFDAVAARARVSVRTVFRYFPTQRDLFAAVAEHIQAHSGWNPDEVTADNIGAMTARAFTYFGTLLADGQHPPESGPPGIENKRALRLEAIARAIGPLTSGLDPSLARGVQAVFSGLMRVHFLRGMYEHWGLDGEAAGRAVEWAMNALLAELRRGDESWKRRQRRATPKRKRGRGTPAA